MNLEIIEMSKFAASEKLKEYRTALKARFNETDRTLVNVYRALAKGKRLLDINKVIPGGGLDARGRPKLAIARADQKLCWYLYQPMGKNYFVHRDRIRLADNSRPQDNHTTHYWDFPITDFSTGLSERGAKAIVPIVPPKHRPMDELSNYHILWEADWEDAPVDPILLKQIDGNFFAVIAQWDLTNVERMVLRSIGMRPR